MKLLGHWIDQHGANALATNLRCRRRRGHSRGETGHRPGERPPQALRHMRAMRGTMAKVFLAVGCRAAWSPSRALALAIAAGAGAPHSIAIAIAGTSPTSAVARACCEPCTDCTAHATHGCVQCGWLRFFFFCSKDEILSHEILPLNTFAIGTPIASRYES